MNVYYRNRKDPTAKYYDRVMASEFISTLEIPNGSNPSQNAWLTITINYAFNFVDGRNPNAKVRYHSGKPFIRDSDGDEFQLQNWDLAAMADFNRRFLKGEDFWNYKFLLITPQDYDGFDFLCLGSGVVCRPNVICLFRLKSGGTPNHVTIDVVRSERSTWQKLTGTNFRSNDRLYQEGDAQTKTLWHELGHALDQLHIRALQGDAQCLVDINADRCYDGDNIMGRGDKLELVNAKPWRESMSQHTGVAQPKWNPTMAVQTPPRKIPLGVALVAKPTNF